MHDPLAKTLHVAHGTRTIAVVSGLEEACRGVDALLLVTPHTAYKQLDEAHLKALRSTMRHGVLVDTRALYRLRPEVARLFQYRALGLPAGTAGHRPTSG